MLASLLQYLIGREGGRAFVVLGNVERVTPKALSISFLIPSCCYANIFSLTSVGYGILRTKRPLYE
jgi:hypothetical protein